MLIQASTRDFGQIVYYLINRSLCVTLNFKTVEKLWSKRPPQLNHLKLFGCLAYIHTNKGKLNSKAFRVVFLRYPMGFKGYKVWLINAH